MTNEILDEYRLQLTDLTHAVTSLPVTSADAFEALTASIEGAARVFEYLWISESMDNNLRAYTNRYNWTHPRRKISWRRLNGKQWREAMDEGLQRRMRVL